MSLPATPVNICLSQRSLRRKLLYDKHIFTGVAGQDMIRLLAPLCLTQAEADRFLEAFTEVLGQ